MTLRQQGLTPDELREAYSREAQRPFGEVDLVDLFGKPPYEFLGQTGTRNWPNYQDFFVDFVDQLGRQYQDPREDFTDRWFVRIPTSLTRRPNHSTYDDYVGFPNAGEILHLTSSDEEVDARVRNTDYEEERAVANIYLGIISRRRFVADLIDDSGRFLMRCVRDDKCFMIDREEFRGNPLEPISSSIDERDQQDDDDADLFFVRLPVLTAKKTRTTSVPSVAGDENTASSSSASTRQQRGRRRRQSSGRVSSNGIARMVANEYVENACPYEVDLDYSPQETVANVNYNEDDDTAPQRPVARRRALRLNAAEKQRYKSRIHAFTKEKCSQHTEFPEPGEVIQAFHLYNDKVYTLRVLSSQLGAIKTPLCTGYVLVRHEPTLSSDTGSKTRASASGKRRKPF